MPSLARVATLAGHEERVWCVSWRPGADPPQLASCGSDRTVRLWGAGAAGAASGDWELLSELDTAEQHSRTLRSLTWAHRGEVLAVTSFDSTCSLWRASGGAASTRLEFAGRVEGHENEVKCAAFSASGEYFATCSRDKSVFIYEVSKDFEYDCVALLQSHTQDVKNVKWHPEQDVLFTCSYDDTVKIWGPDGDDWSCMETLSGHKSTVWCLAFDPCGSRFATCSDDRTVRLWAPAQQVAEKPAEKPAAEFVAPRGVAAAAFITPLFRSVGSLVQEDALGAGGLLTRCAAKRRQAPPEAACRWVTTAQIEDASPRPVYSVDWSPSALAGSFTAIASACGDNRVRIFQPVAQDCVDGAWECTAEVEAHDGDANCVAWCPTPLPGGAALLASAGDDNDVKLWRFCL